ncbi:dihydroneopterin aldolase [Tepidibacter formicigenes]|jgi:dihydroneopterin aldolase|uniref:7,8-dihydroneopterin aldolase n=1 Tax=Tepidibacter formicigenes DSM 15518 TaxID=1123349 RepID=A0A1M6PH11_9FIRM|nr:dihydroneopterin aldolase [Tepidibacter formicigenes]SHK07180.1 dihydroneopterin aldolase [Tepidibacter formicigenes DSM 15518]
MDKIILNNLGFYGYHGVFKEENVLGQKFFIDIELYLDLKKAGQTDDVNESVSYAQVYDLVKNICENEKYNLLEALCENISKQIFNEFNLVKEIMVRVKKPEAPVNGMFDYFGVEIRRKRDE